MAEKAPKNKGGRPPRYRAEYAQQAGKLCMLGYTDARLIEFFEIGAATLYRWKNRHPEFKAACLAGKEIVDADVMSALYHSAIGYKVTKQKAINTPKGIEVVEVTEEIPPNPASLGMWLYNRQPQLFKRDPTPADDDRDTPADPLTVTFGVDAAVDEVRVTRGKPKT